MLKLSRVDQFIDQLDKGLRTLNSAHRAFRETPSASQTEVSNTEQETQRKSKRETETVNNQQTLNEADQKLSASLMRVNHCGEVCAQALYQGQALTAKDSFTRNNLQEAADEEIDHLVWCEERLHDLNSHTSVLNPLWYSLSFAIGATTGLLGDKISLGFVAATEEQVSKHLRSHLNELPQQDKLSRAVLEQMLVDEEKHGQAALDAGGYNFPQPVKLGMTLVSKVMTSTTRYI